MQRTFDNELRNKIACDTTRIAPHFTGFMIRPGDKQVTYQVLQIDVLTRDSPSVFTTRTTTVETHG